MPKKKGKGLQPNSASWQGNGTKWLISDYFPGWNLDDQYDANGELDKKNEIEFDPNLQGVSRRYLPFYVHNDAVQDGTDVVFLSVDDGDTSVGFSKETYVLREAWDQQPEDFSETNSDIVNGDDRYTRAEINTLTSQMYLVDGRADAFNSAAETPQLVAGSGVQEAVILIEDAQGPAPRRLGSGNDTVQGTAGIDVIYAGAGNDVISGEGGDDTIRGEAGDDLLTGGIGSDTLLGEAGRDTLRGGDDDDVIYGGSGNDSLDGGADQDVLVGMAGNDTLQGGTGRDAVIGGAGDDLIDGGTGDDYLFGGTGNDTYVVDDTFDRIIDTRGTGIETVLSSVNWELGNTEVGLDHLTLQEGSAATDGTGNDLNNRITGNSNNNLLIGNLGNDTLNGAGGSDRLNGYGTTLSDVPQFDTLDGGAGIDTFILGGTWGVSYVETGDGYAVIQNWQAQDRIEVRNGLGQYDLQTRNVIGSGAADTEIYFTNSSGQRDRIAIVQDKTNISITQNFVFV